MYILTQDSEAIYEITGYEYIAVTEDGKVVLGNIQYTYALGQYKSLERAKEVVAEIFVMIGSVSKYEMPVI